MSELTKEEVLEQASKLDPAEVERIMLEREQKKSEEIEPSELASMMLTLYTPRFCYLVDKLSSRQLRRVTKSIVEYPIGNVYKHTDELEKECFAIGKNLLDAKYVLVADTYNNNREKILQQAAEAASNASIETVYGEKAQELNEEGKEN